VRRGVAITWTTKKRGKGTGIERVEGGCRGCKNLKPLAAKKIPFTFQTDPGL